MVSPNNFKFTLPVSKREVTFKLLTHGDEQKIDAEIKGLQKINPNSSADVTTRLKYIITSVEGKNEKKDIRDFVDNYLLARDSRDLRKHIKQTQPDVDLTFFPDGSSDRIDIPVGLKFFWPDL